MRTILRWQVLAVAITLSFCSLLAWQNNVSHEKATAEVRFSRLVDGSQLALESRMAAYNQALISAAAYMVGSDHVSRSEWRSYVEIIGIDQTLPGILGLGFIANVPNEELDAYLARERADETSDFTVHPADYTDQYYIIEYIEPVLPNKEALGLNIAFETNRRNAADLATASGMSAVTGKILLVQDSTRTPGFLVLHPVMGDGTLINPAQDKRSNLSGWTYAPFLASSFFSGLTVEQAVLINLSVYDGHGESEDGLIYESVPNGDTSHAPAFAISRTINLMQREWTVTWTSTEEFERAASSWVSAAILFIGLLLTLATCVLLAQVLERNRLIQNRVTSATRDLDAALKSLTAVLATVPDGILTIDDRGRVSAFNPAAERIFGYSAEEVIGKNVKMLMPDPYHSEHDGYIQNYLNSGEKKIIGIGRTVSARRKNGQVFPMELAVREMNVGGERRFVGSIRDISERHAAQKALAESHARFELATDSGGIGIWGYERATEQVTWDHWMYRLYGRSPLAEGDPNEFWLSSIHQDDQKQVVSTFERSLESLEPLNLEFRVLRPDGSTRHLKSSGHWQKDDDGATSLIGASWDVTDIRELSEEYAEQHELLRVTLDSIGDAVITTDPMGLVTWMNPVAEKLTGWCSSEALGTDSDAVLNIHLEDSESPAASPIKAVLETGEVVGLDERTLLRSKEGIEFAIEDSAAPIRDKSGNVIGTVLVFRDVSEQRRLSKEMRYRATHDPLTGLVNRAEFDHQLSMLFQREEDPENPATLLCVDLDRFKIVNDTCGHPAGDDVLKKVAIILRQATRAQDIVCRLGGDEFAVLLDNCSVAQATEIGNRICEQVDQFRFSYMERPFRIGASIGLCPISSEFSGPSEILKAADGACYAAKEAGRNRVEQWQKGDNVASARSEQMNLVTKLEHALETDGFELFGQRIKPLNSSRDGVHLEMLLRVKGPDNTYSSPGPYLAAAERFHLSGRVDKWVLSRAVAWLKEQDNRERVELVGINLSGQSVGDATFHKTALDILRQAGPDVCRRICLELTETSAILNLDQAADFLSQARSLGLQVALDDFGAGSSSFDYVRSLDFDYLKIDGQFIRNIESDELSRVTTQCFVNVAMVKGAKTVAEFVQSDDALSILTDMGVDFAQGFHVHEPSPLDECLAA